MTVPSSTVRCLHRLAVRGLPSLTAAHQSLSASSSIALPANGSASIASFALPPMPSSLLVAAAATPSRTARTFSAGANRVGNNVKDAMAALAQADAVCFDVDSTVITEEGIDVLAATLGKGPEVRAWTARAMDGDTKFEEALAARLEILRPSRGDIAACLAAHPLELSPGVATLVAALQERGTAVFLVSGGFRLMIEPVAEALGVPLENIYANTILFDDEGDYAGFDAAEPTSADQGKPRALGLIKQRFGYRTMVMVGDGATDAQAKPPANAFIGFGGVVARAAVQEQACWFVRDFEEMIDIVEGKASPVSRRGFDTRKKQPHASGLDNVWE